MSGIRTLCERLRAGDEYGRNVEPTSFPGKMA